jgi:hypothetical protein
MRNQRLGCLTSTGIIATLLTTIVIVVVLVLQGGTMFSPGALNAQAGETRGGVTAHAQAACRDCHSAPWEADHMADRCAACHTDIVAQMQEVATLHGSITNHNPGISCTHCHPDHRGSDASLTIATLADFPHEELGFSLNGHPLTAQKEAFVCKDCHTLELSSFDQVVCVECHLPMNESFLKPHVAAWGADCLACHDGVDTYGSDFNHDQFPFQLAGKHAQIACYDCHAQAQTALDLRNLPADCASCHQKDDAHQGQFGSDCGACHGAEGWKPAKFDHNLSAFKLEGEHAETACADCHQNGVYKGTPSDCYSCHARNDEHNGQYGTDCAFCHTPADWERVTFDHSKSKFPLVGAHERVDCAKCHTNNQFAGTPSTCVSCHADPIFHAGEFGTQCESCHTAIAWSPATYNGSHPGIADEGGFGVNHGHTTCKTCHPSTVNDYTCLACHSNNFGEGGDD